MLVTGHCFELIMAYILVVHRVDGFTPHWVVNAYELRVVAAAVETVNRNSHLFLFLCALASKPG